MCALTIAPEAPDPQHGGPCRRPVRKHGLTQGKLTQASLGEYRRRASCHVLGRITSGGKSKWISHWFPQRNRDIRRTNATGVSHEKRCRPEISHKWWSSNKGVTVPSTGLGDALKITRSRRTNPRWTTRKCSNGSRRLDSGGQGHHQVQQDPARRNHRGPEEYPGVIKTEREWINKNYEAYQKRFLEEAEGRVPPQMMSAPGTVFFVEPGRAGREGRRSPRPSSTRLTSTST